MPEGFYNTYLHAENDIASYIQHYNYRRGHSCNNYLAPAVAEAS